MAESKKDGTVGYEADDDQQLHSIGFYLNGAFVPVASVTYGRAAGAAEHGDKPKDEKESKTKKDGE